MSTEIEIRPGLASLSQQPTLHQVSDTWGTLELKLETECTRYWVTTEGLEEKSSEAPVNYVKGYVTVEKRRVDGSWDLSAVYSPDAWKLSQALDYCRMIQNDLRQVRKRLKIRHGWELVREAEQLTEEISQVNKMILSLSRKLYPSNI